jgi:hypothetical protein
MRSNLVAVGATVLLGVSAAQAGDPHWFGPGYYEYQCGGPTDCSLVSGPHEKLSVCMKWVANSQAYIEDFFPGEDIAPHKCDYFADKPADTEHFSHS